MDIGKGYQTWVFSISCHWGRAFYDGPLFAFVFDNRGAFASFCLGLFGGIYQVPLHAYIQFVSPEHKRGQVLALNNFLDFSGVLLAAGFVRLLGSGLHLTPDQSFLYMGSLVVCFAVLSLWLLKEHVYRLLLTRVLSRQLGQSFTSPKAEEVSCFLFPRLLTRKLDGFSRFSQKRCAAAYSF